MNKNQVLDVDWLIAHKEEFMKFSEDKKRNVLGELMFKKVNAIEGIDSTKVSKITGMLIDLDILELEEIIEMILKSNNL